jgi:hypothetical protein
MDLKSLKNLLFLNNINLTGIILLCFYSSDFKCQGIANHINNGGFEDYWSCNLPNNLLLVKSWRTIDSTANATIYYSKCPNINNIPLNGFTYQFPKSGDAFVSFTSFCLSGSCSPDFNRNYLRNRLKSPLENGHTYCLRFFYNILNNSTYGVDGLGIKFCDNNSLDTITKSNLPLIYLTPQLENPTNNILTDTMNWNLFTGTFTATGNEVNAVIGNFKSNASTNSILINPTYSPQIVNDFCIDNVSCIDIDLPAYAGPDLWCIPGDSVFIGRQPDVGIDEACMWYKLPNTTTAIDTVAGLWVKPVTTTTYIVKQEICAGIKYDTIVVHQSATGIGELDALINNLKLYPQPASSSLKLQFKVDLSSTFSSYSILNNLGQVIREDDVQFKNNATEINTSDLPNGVYTISLFRKRGFKLSKRFVVARN